ncbi:hypothetical protein FIBSPDRAFT_1054658 [Athelia psychrophila]|uniref:Protein prenylyltransferase n=1 Tax=Athelia psychrophila TaxID=1759441 RepID=A0A167UZA0_9AGAM|nr:hypothetical protein FIBSPDRAFT_1054658 [Fibularhizoctonia sp. CBS 109695]
MSQMTPRIEIDRLVDLLTLHSQTVEILPGDYSLYAPAEGEHETSSKTKPFLLVDGNLGVPKKALYRIYLFALQIFAQSRVSWDATLSDSDDMTRGLVAASAVILLANPAHTTALNARKRLLQAGVLQCGTELKFTEALLSSRNCSNQSIMWHHRQWLLSRLRIEQEPALSEAPSDMQHKLWGAHTTLEAEVAISTRACEIYPRNYFAWAHRWFCVNEVISLVSVVDSPSAAAGVILSDIAVIKQWMETHISDASAVHYLICVMERTSTIVDIRAYADDIQLHAISLVKIYPEHETMWLYLRAAYHLRGDSPDLQQFLREVAHPWASQILPCPGHDDEVVSRFAYRFLAQKAMKAEHLLEINSSARDIVAAKPGCRPSLDALWLNALDKGNDIAR